MNNRNIANKWKRFFTKGQKISNTVNWTTLELEDFVTLNPSPTNREFGNISLAAIENTVNLFEPKLSPDLDGLSMKLLEEIAIEISTPLSHIFVVGIDSGIFLERLQISRTVPTSTVLYIQGRK